MTAAAPVNPPKPSCGPRFQAMSGFGGTVPAGSVDESTCWPSMLTKMVWPDIETETVCVPDRRSGMAVEVRTKVGRPFDEPVAIPTNGLVGSGRCVCVTRATATAD
jgi:hypothetical protein